jgi:hypothetical protein
LSKYDSLREHLFRLRPPVEMTFEEIGALVGGLPRSAEKWSAWWGNDEGHVQARAWMSASRRVEAVDLNRRRVRFV